MKKAFKRFLLSQMFTYFSIVLVMFCIASVALLDANHPLYAFSILCGVIVFVLQRYRKRLLKA